MRNTPHKVSPLRINNARVSNKRKMELGDLVTVKKHGRVILQRNEDKDFWIVAEGHQRIWQYKSSTWAENKYSRLLSVNGFEEGNVFKKENT